ncbi:MAG: FkbM family methyltransferase [Bacteroidetes bacterium]|nr:FkbM family methyltransferase [Bacteroidota bacterium]
MRTFVKKLYRFIPLKKEFYTLLKTIWKPQERIYKHLHFVGVIKVKVDEGSSFKIKHYGFQIENEIFWAGLTNGWEKESMKLWIKLCKRSKTILDIGANTGVYSLVAKTINPGAAVYAFEPVTRVFNKLKDNISLNDFDIVPIKKAVSNADGVAVIYDTLTEHIYSVTVNKNLASSEVTVYEEEIETIKLDTFVSETGIQNIDLIKVDVETHEPEVLDGFLNNLFKFKPTFLIEILNNEVGKRVNTIMQKTDYLYFNIDENGGLRQVEEITQSDYYNYLLCSAEIAREIGFIK